MDIRLSQSCPQCGGAVLFSETDHLLTCPYCQVTGVISYQGPAHYTLPVKAADLARAEAVIHVPYLRFKGTIFLVSRQGVSCRVVDTSQLGCDLPGLMPSLGLRPQAVPLSWVTPHLSGHYLPLEIAAREVLLKAMRVGHLLGSRFGQQLHRAYIGESISFIYLPLLRQKRGWYDGVTGIRLTKRLGHEGKPVQPQPFNPRWQLGYRAALCPRCGWNLSGDAQSVVLLCQGCDTAWAVGEQSWVAQPWFRLAAPPVSKAAVCYLAFWRIQGVFASVAIKTYADFLRQTNQPVVVQAGWEKEPVGYWVPAFKARPKIFLQLAKQATLAQHLLRPVAGQLESASHPVTLAASEALQAVKTVLAEVTVVKRDIYDQLSTLRLQEVKKTLVYLPFVDQGYDWVQPETGMVIAKQVLDLGRRL